MADNDTFQLYDLTVVVEAIEGNCTCSMQVGDCFYLHGGKLSLPEGKDFCVYALQSTLPLLPAKQRVTHPHDWMTTDAEIACPDPHCGGRFRIIRTGTSTFRHADVTAVPLPAPRPARPRHRAAVPARTRRGARR